MSVEQRILQFAQLAAITLVIVSCYEVLRVFIPAILFAAVVCISTWPLYLHLRRWLRGQSTLLIVLVIGPTALLAVNLADSVMSVIDATKVWLNHGPIDPPAWLKETPMFGGRLNDYWQGLASGREEAVTLLKQMIEPVRNFLFGAVAAIGQSLLQMVFAAFIGFFFYRDGEALVQMLRDGLIKLAGELGEALLTAIQHTVAGVVQGVFGTALAQAIVAVIGYLIAGVPGAFLLAAATFFLSMLPIGPPLLWIGASIWLYSQGSHGWAIFMVLWGVFAISSIDNVVKPYLISRGSNLSLLLITLGVFGGIFAFGFIGIFIGPPVLAVGLILVRLWTAQPANKKDSH
jgi:predicted PurR-regulated permease PerM